MVWMKETRLVYLLALMMAKHWVLMMAYSLEMCWVHPTETHWVWLTDVGSAKLME